MLPNYLTDAVVVAIVLGVMILVHELGHFLAAKGFGVRVRIFSIGFGKRLFGFKRGDTDYRVSALPLGGYVKMAGDDPRESHEGDPGEFLGRPRWQRFVIVAMGPTMNVLMAVVLLSGLYRYHFQKPAIEEQPARVGDVEPGSPAARAGVLSGDLIVRLDGIVNPKWQDVIAKIPFSAGETIQLEIVRDGRHLDLTITPKAEGRDEMGYAGWIPYLPAFIESVNPEMPAAQAGLQPGDQVVGVDGKKVYDSVAIVRALQSADGKPVEFAVQRQGKEFRVRLRPVYSSAGGQKKWRIGVAFEFPFVVRQLPWRQAITVSVEENWNNSLMTFDVLGKILTRRMSARSLSGPIGIAQLSGEMYRAGIDPLLKLVSAISLQLGIFNLLPIPILDGGVILLLLIESVMRRDLSVAVKERVVQVGMVFLLLLAVFVMYNDIVKTFRPY